jgi:hypothetical protein
MSHEEEDTCMSCEDIYYIKLLFEAKHSECFAFLST